MNFERNFIEFLLGSELKRITWDSNQRLSPTTTVLQYLRGIDGHKGTKEGCAEGDCGACTVVVASINENETLSYNALNSCLLFLPQIHGKQLITVEHLAQGKNLHPVQKAMIDMNASQCGFCTPGFVMSLFALYKTIQHPTNEEIMEAFSGNLCRCTGYRSIIDAAHVAFKNFQTDSFDNTEQTTLKVLQSISNTDARLTNPQQTYYSARNLTSALNLKFSFPEIEVNAGSSDVALRVTKKKELITSLLDISGIKELSFINESALGIEIGSGTTLQSLKETLGNRFPSLKKVLDVFGSKQIRQVATLGGNTGSASPIGDLIPLFMAYDARVILKSLIQERSIKITDFIKGYHKTDLMPGELIFSIFIPHPQEGILFDFEKVSKRTDLDITTVSVAMALELTPESSIKQIQIYYGGMAATVQKAYRTCNFLEGKLWNRATIEDAKSFIDIDFTPLSDARADAFGRMVLAKNLLLKLWLNQQNH